MAKAKTPFPRRSINMAIQSQVFTTYIVHKSILYTTTSFVIYSSSSTSDLAAKDSKLRAFCVSVKNLCSFIPQYTWLCSDSPELLRLIEAPSLKLSFLVWSIICCSVLQKITLAFVNGYKNRY